ncbi:MAG: DUF2520 domain-containing protein, partial [Flavobacteriales bacterium]|nr:DUF2520 domain-containing protein [Flavobacteriales bacterium]
VKEQLFTLFGLVSDKVVYLDEKQREHLHLSAVLSNNFTNYLYTISKEILDENDIDFSILTGLISQSAKQIENVSPEKSQTGPAMRNESKVIEKHLKLLENKPEYYNLYKFVSESIIKKYHG